MVGASAESGATSSVGSIGSVPPASGVPQEVQKRSPSATTLPHTRHCIKGMVGRGDAEMGSFAESTPTRHLIATNRPPEPGQVSEVTPQALPEIT